MFNKILIANRGEIACRVAATARRLAIKTVAVYSDADANAKHVSVCDESVYIGGSAPSESYLRKLHNRTQATMVPTRAMLQELQGRGYDNVTLVSRGVAIEQFRPDCRSEALRASWGVQPGDPVVILVGRLAKEKNVSLVVWRLSHALCVSTYMAISTCKKLSKSTRVQMKVTTRFGGSTHLKLELLLLVKTVLALPAIQMY